ncbi:hypothetical protein HY989_04265 [Candidatus Micrarchaeota archaeon]|nr:hypothetical protein [Candidatus Micrarchaeota archaeon]
MQNHKKKRQILRREEAVFLAKFLIIFFLLFGILKIIDLSAMLFAIAQFESSALNFVGIGSKVVGTQMLLYGNVVEFVEECSGLIMVILLIALLWGSKIQNERRLKYLAIFTPALLAFNLIRLFATLWVLAIFPYLFEYFHIFLWFVDSAIVMLIWIRAIELGK